MMKTPAIAALVLGVLILIGAGLGLYARGVAGGTLTVSLQNGGDGEVVVGVRGGRERVVIGAGGAWESVMRSGWELEVNGATVEVGRTTHIRNEVQGDGILELGMGEDRAGTTLLGYGGSTDIYLGEVVWIGDVRLEVGEGE